MTASIGIALAFVAMLCWGFGDFMIQKSTRKLGDWETLFIITAFGTIILLPFVWHKIPILFSSNTEGVVVLLAASVILFVAAILDLEALRKGKLAIVEPIWSLEIISSSVLAFFILDQRISAFQTILIILLMVALMLVAFKGRLTKAMLLEKGVFIAGIAALTMGCANFFMGWGGRVSDPIMTNFFTDAFLAIGSGAYLAYKGKFFQAFSDFRHGYPLLLPMSIADKVAWIAYVFSMTLAPIAIATALSESYIIITVLLGLYVNKEKLHRHQKIGLIGALIVAITLAAITSA